MLNINMFTYNAIVNRVIDGDTVVIDIDLGFGLWIKEESVQLTGIDAPESRTSDLHEKMFGLHAKQYVENLLPEGSNVVYTSTQFQSDKYGRSLGDFQIGDSTLTALMLEDRVAAVYRTGSEKQLMEDEHLANYQHLLGLGKVLVGNSFKSIY